MMKKSFLNFEKPPMVAMILCRTPEECIAKIRASKEAGAEAYGVQLCKLERQYRTPEIIREIFAACGDKPIYVTSYRGGSSQGMTDEECVELLLMGLDCGATICDVIGDLYDKGAKYELTMNPEAIRKQKALIDEIHRRGGEVLISCHTKSCLTVEENLMIAREQADRGADVIKIVNNSQTADDLLICIESIHRIIEQTGKKLLLLAGGPARMIRYIGPNFGVCMYLCLEHCGDMDSTAQPLIKHLKAVREQIGT